jgi:hypothetical protein
MIRSLFVFFVLQVWIRVEKEAWSWLGVSWSGFWFFCVFRHGGAAILLRQPPRRRSSSQEQKREAREKWERAVRKREKRSDEMKFCEGVFNLYPSQSRACASIRYCELAILDPLIVKSDASDASSLWLKQSNKSFFGIFYLNYGILILNGYVVQKTLCLPKSKN